MNSSRLCWQGFVSKGMFMGIKVSFLKFLARTLGNILRYTFYPGQMEK